MALLTEPRSLIGLELLMEGSKTLARIEANGIVVDIAYCIEQQRRLGVLLKKEQRKIEESRVGKVWKRRFGSHVNWGSGDQLGKTLFEDLGYEPKTRTATGRASTSEDSLSEIDDPVVKSFLLCKKYIKASHTYLRGFLAETTDGFMHPSFNLHLVKTYRSSSDSPNFQNIPIRDPWFGKLIRKAVRSRPGHRLVEMDYGGLEVAVAACYHKDPAMIRYIKDPDLDMHRDMAAECFKIPVTEVTKKIRYHGKNGFVFPAFYGSYWMKIAPHLWDARGEHTTSGASLEHHLSNAHGITELGTVDWKTRRPTPGSFMAHIKKVDENFWGKRFKVYGQWRRDWYDAYVKTGMFESLTGFVCRGYMKRNDVINYPVQGSAFHCLLWTIIMVEAEMQKRKMKSLIVGQIHDSIVSDVLAEEFDEYVALVKYVGTEVIRAVWDWIIVPLEMEVEASPVDGTWFDKEVVNV